MLEKEFNESTNALRVELNRMEEAKLLISENNMNRKYFMVNFKHPLYEDIKRLVHKELGIEQIIDRIICCVGDLESAYIIGNFAHKNLLFLIMRLNETEIENIKNLINPLHCQTLILLTEFKKFHYQNANPCYINYQLILIFSTFAETR